MIKERKGKERQREHATTNLRNNTVRYSSFVRLN